MIALNIVLFVIVVILFGILGSLILASYKKKLTAQAEANLAAADQKRLKILEERELDQEVSTSEPSEASLSNLRDMTRQIVYMEKELERRSKFYEERYNNLIQIIPHPIYRINVNGYFDWVTEGIAQFGWDPEELKGKHFSDIIYPDDIEKVSRDFVLPHFIGANTGDVDAPKLFDERRTGNRATKGLAVRIVPPGWKETYRGEVKTGLIMSFGEVYAAGVYDSPIRDGLKKFVGTLGLIQDITELVLLREKQRPLGK
jgi:PAS domain S-box-containing protein